MKLRFAIAAIVVAVFILALGFKSSQAREEGPATGVMTKLQEVVKNQQMIMQKLDDIKKELAIVKIRATRR